MRTHLLSLALHLPRPISLLSLAVLCPEDSQETQNMDLTDNLKTMRESFLELMEDILRGGRKIEDLMKAITGNVFETKPN